ncbi:MAG: protein translocase subunit SecF [Microthrixaceae bacterium]|nr:protein translocase subunit SecF [Microthrixaceae bacterium]
MGALTNLYRGRNDINFPRLWRPIVAFSVLLVVASIVSLVVRGVNLSIDFEGGAVWEVPTKSMSVDGATDVLAEFDKAEGAKVQIVTDANNKRIVRVQADSEDVRESQKIAAALAEKAGIDIEDVATNTVGPSWGKEITSKALQSLVIFILLVAAYIAWQLEWRMAVAALIGVAHDILITVGIYSIAQLEVTPATVISFLTILGYSLYDTIVVYDRLKENSARYDRGGQYTYKGIMRRSLNQVIMRSVNTTMVSLLPVLSMMVVGATLLGQPVLRDFSLALLIGLFSGAYSSIFIASPVLSWLKEREPRYRRIRARAEERGDVENADHMPVGAPVAGRSKVASGDSPVAGSSTIAVAAKAGQYQRSHPPRPRKQGKRR